MLLGFDVLCIYCFIVPTCKVQADSTSRLTYEICDAEVYPVTWVTGETILGIVGMLLGSECIFFTRWL